MSAANELNAGERLITHAADVTDKAQVAALVDAVTRRLGRIDMLVNNAGANVKNRAVKDMDLETWDRQIAANLNSAFYCIFAVLPQMRARQDGVIVNVSSISGKRATPLGGIAYSAAKFGMSAVGICLGVEEKDNGIRVTNIYPGEVDTPILVNRPVAVDGGASGEDSEAGGRGGGGVVRVLAAAAGARAGADHHADEPGVCVKAHRSGVICPQSGQSRPPRPPRPPCCAVTKAVVLAEFAPGRKCDDLLEGRLDPGCLKDGLKLDFNRRWHGPGLA